MRTAHDHAPAGGAIESSDKATCPVMEMSVSKKETEKNGLVRIHDGQQYYLCCSTCAAQFDADPERYTTKEVKA